MFYKIFLSPSFLIVAISIFSLSVNLYLFDDWGDGHSLYSIGIISFVLGYFWVKWPERVLRKKYTKKKFFSGQPKEYVIKIYWVLASIGFLISLYIFIFRGVMVSGSILFNLRLSHTFLNESTLGAGHFSLFGFALSLYYMYIGKLKYSVLALFLSMGPVFAFAARTSLFMRLIGFSYVGIWTRRLSLRQILLVVIFFISISILIAAGTNKLGNSEESYFLFRYVGYGISSFETWIMGVEPNYCFTGILGNVLGGIIDYVFQNTCDYKIGTLPGFFNVYTYLEAPYSFAGTPGVIFSMLMLGMLYGILFIFAQDHQYFLMILSAYIYPLLMVFFDWQFSLTTFIYLFIIFLPLFYKRKSANSKEISS